MSSASDLLAEAARQRTQRHRSRREHSRRQREELTRARKRGLGFRLAQRLRILSARESAARPGAHSSAPLR